MISYLVALCRSAKPLPVAREKNRWLEKNHVVQIGDFGVWCETDTDADALCMFIADLRAAEAEVAALKSKAQESANQTLKCVRELQEWEDKEAACCPEDFGFEEYIAVLTKQRDESRAEVAALKSEREKIRRALTATDAEVGPACMLVAVPETIVMDEPFRGAYVQGYRHALTDARAEVAALTAQIRELEMEMRSAVKLSVQFGVPVIDREGVTGWANQLRAVLGAEGPKSC